MCFGINRGVIKMTVSSTARYVNLLQDYAAPAYWGVQTYEQYLQQYITTNKPQLLSFDHYPFFQADNKVAPDETVILLHPPFFL